MYLKDYVTSLVDSVNSGRECYSGQLKCPWIKQSKYLQMCILLESLIPVELRF